MPSPAQPIGEFISKDFVELASLNRAGLVESRHFGIAVLTSPDGSVFAQYGDSSQLMYPRSAVKPLQTVASRRAGLYLQGAQLAISSGSHQGTAQHVALVEAILADAGLDFSSLQCPVAWPGNAAARSLVQAPSKQCFNCSGKHAAFLAACVTAGWDVKTYLDPQHPLQVLIKQVIEEFAGESVSISTIDGCGAPLHALSLAGLARSIGRFALTEKAAAEAMLDHPWAVGGQDSPDFFVLQEGMVAKLGAEGVFVIGLKTGHGVAVKVADGALRAAPSVALKVLLNSGLLERETHLKLGAKLDPQVLGGTETVGAFEVLI